MSKAPGGNGWDKDKVSIRISDERRKRLATIARSLGEQASVTKAIDHCIDIASSDIDGMGLIRGSLGGISALSDEISGKVTGLASDSAEGFQKTLAGVDDIKSEMEEMRKALSLIAGAATGDPYMDGQPMSISEWIQRTTDDEPACQYLLARATWQAMSRHGAESIDMDALVERVAIKQDAHPTRRKSPPAVVRVERVATSPQLFFKTFLMDFYIICQRRPDGAWRLDMREIGPSNSVGQASIAAFDL